VPAAVQAATGGSVILLGKAPINLTGGANTIGLFFFMDVISRSHPILVGTLNKSTVV
jgi:hypothetical protein